MPEAMPATDRLSGLDEAFLALDTARSPMHVGWTIRFGGTPPTLAALRRHLDRRLHLVPRFRRRVVAPPFGLGDARWADDPGFDVARHVHAVSLPPPGGAAELRELAGVLLAAPLDPARPLWQVHLVRGLHRGGFALLGQVHHALVDGIAAIEVAMLLFGPEPDADTPPFAPQPGRPLPVQAAASVAARAVGLARAAREAAASASRPGATLAGAQEALRDAAGAAEGLLRPAPRTSLDGSRTPAREVAFATVGLDGVQEAGRRLGATVNDVLLAASTLALGRALRRRGEDREALKALVPVNIRGEGQSDAQGNKISFLAVDLPVAETDPLAVLERVRDDAREAKSGHTPAPIAAALAAADLLPRRGRALAARSVLRLTGFNLIISNVPGPPVELSLMGRPMQAIFPAVPIPDGHALTIGALSYGGRLHVGLLADAAIVPDAVDVAREVEKAFDVLQVAALAEPPAPGRARPRPPAARAAAGAPRPGQPAASR
jgi:WS/DGAT/MGAT family acyltransferase